MEREGRDGGPSVGFGGGPLKSSVNEVHQSAR